MRWIIFLMLLAMAGCSRQSFVSPPPVLLFSGCGASPGSVAAIERILKKERLGYHLVDASKLNGMSKSDLMAYRLMIVPGGNYIEMGENLSSETTSNVHNAVQDGLNYLGICAGGLLAGKAHCNSFDLTGGVAFDFYSIVRQGVHKSVVPVTCFERLEEEFYWEDGPQFTGWGDTIGKYPDGSAAIVEGYSGDGWVILVGVHPEALESWRRGLSFKTPASANHVFAAKLIRAALDRTKFPHF